MMSLSQWAGNISKSLEPFYNLDFQIRAWLRGEGPEVSSLDEAICKLFDDSDFKGFLKLPEIRSNKKLFHALNEIYLALDSITDDIISDEKIEESFLGSPIWQRIIRLSKKAKMELEKAREQWTKA